MAIVHINQKAKAESGYIVSGHDAKKLMDYLFHQTPEEVNISIKKEIDRFQKSKENRKKLKEL
jgi:hypothetical protein